jgi:hypothetical protein
MKVSFLELRAMVQTKSLADQRVSAAYAKLGRVVAAVKRSGKDSEFDRALNVLKQLSQKENIPIAIVGGAAAIWHVYERLTHDVDVVIARQHLDTITRVAPNYGIKVIWRDPRGWHKLQYDNVRIEIVPEGGQPSKNAPTTIPGPAQLGVVQGAEYAHLAGWVETKLGSGRRQDQADVVQVLKKTNPADIETVRGHLASVHPRYVNEFEELLTAANEEKLQEEERGGKR